MKDFRKKYPNNVNTTKVTISKDNLSNLNSIIKFFVENNMKYKNSISGKFNETNE